MSAGPSKVYLCRECAHERCHSVVQLTRAAEVGRCRDCGAPSLWLVVYIGRPCGDS